MLEVVHGLFPSLKEVGSEGTTNDLGRLRIGL